MAKRGLGRGLDSLIPAGIQAKETAPSEQDAGIAVSGEPSMMVRVTKLEPNRDQPRKKFDEESLNELSESIRQVGLLQPILVQPRGDRYEIVAGERRWRAARKAGLKEVPVIVRNLTDREIMEISLIENIQREDLNPIEEAQAYRKLIEEFHLKQEEVASRVSKNRTTVTNSMRLLKLCDEVQQMVVEDKISTGHARALIGIEDPKEQRRLAQRICDEKLSVREVEKLVRDIHRPPREKSKQNSSIEAVYRNLEEQLKQALGTRVAISPRQDGGGKIGIEYYDTQDLERLAGILTGQGG